jgi:TonB family protein
MSRERRSPGVTLPLLISLLLHLLGFAAFSLQALWPVRVAESRPPAFRVVSVDLPKPKETVPENPESRLLSDAARRESGQGKPGAEPQLKEEKEDKVPARRGSPEDQVASVPPSPPVQAVPPSLPSPPQPEARKPEPEEAVQEPPKLEPRPAQLPSPPPRPEATKPAPPQEQAKLVPPRPERPQPPREAPRPPKPPKEEVKKPEPRREPPKPPQKTQPPQPPKDPLAMFRAQPKGRPDAPDLRLSDEEADRIARASLQKDLKKEEVGEAISLDTRDFRFASYFAHIKERIQQHWSWPREARDYTGKLVLRFVIAEDGRLRQVELLTSSGYRILDDEALSAVAKAAPFNPFPSDLGRKFLNIEGTFVYEHAGRRVVP